MKIEKHDCKNFYYKRRYFGRKLRCSSCGKVVSEFDLTWDDIKTDILQILGFIQQG